MSFISTDGASGFYRNGDLPAVNAPLTLSIWLRYETTGSDEHPLALCSSTGGPSGEDIGQSANVLHQDSATNESYATHNGATVALYTGSYLNFASARPSTISFKGNAQWGVYVCVFGDKADRSGLERIWVKGFGCGDMGVSVLGPNATSGNVNFQWSTFSTLSLGFRYTLDSASPLDSRRYIRTNSQIAHAAIWPIELPEWAARHVADGYSVLDLPRALWPAEYYPCDDSPAGPRCLLTGKALTPFGTGMAVGTDHPTPLRSGLVLANGMSRIAASLATVDAGGGGGGGGSTSVDIGTISGIAEAHVIDYEKRRLRTA